MKLHTKLILIIAGTFVLSCNKFLDVKPKGIIIPENTAEFESVLNSEELVRTFIPELITVSDDVLHIMDQNAIGERGNAYFWREHITEDIENDPAAWGRPYNNIYHTNVIINNILESKGGTEAMKQQVLAEALLVRAYIYHELLTLFAKAYDPATAATDPGLPLVTDIDIQTKAPPRSSVKECFDYMISDINKAIPNLPANNINRYRVTKYAAYGLLCRLYLYMGDYANAKLNAEKSLEVPHSYLDYNKYSGLQEANGFPWPDSSPEVIWQRGAYNMYLTLSELYSDNLMNLFDSTIFYQKHPDLRYRYLTITTNQRLANSYSGGNLNMGITVAEMELTRAEISARNGDVNAAMQIVNTLRKNRIATDAYKDLVAATPEEALKIVLLERRKEFAFKGIRWFDMKRLDKEGRMPTVYRQLPASSTASARIVDSLPPHSPKYTFQIPLRVLSFNPDMEKNKR